MDLRNLAFRVDFQGDTGAVTKMDAATTGLKDNLTGLTSKLEGVSNSMKAAGKVLTTKLTLPIVGAGAAAAKFSTDFNKDMATISTMIPGQTARLQELKSSIQDVAVEVGKDTSEIAQGTYGVISAYGDAADTMEKVAINAKAATAGLATTEDALNLSSAVMKGFGDTSAKANEKVMDLAFGTLKLGQTSFPELASSIGQVVPLVTELGASQEEMFGVYAAATGVTGNAAEVSTQLRGILQSLMAPTKEMTELMTSLGYSSGKAMIESEGLGGTVKEIVLAAQSSGKPLKDYIGSIQGQTLALAMAGNLSEDYNNKLHELKSSAGMMEGAFREQTEGINATGFTFEQSMVKMKVAGQKFGDAMAPMLSKGANLLAGLADKMNALTPAQMEMVTGIAAVTAATGPLLTVGGRTVGLIASMPEKIETAKTAMDVLKGAISPTTLIVMGLVAAGVALYKNWDKIKEGAAKAWGATTKIVEGAVSKIKGYWEGLKNFLKNPIKGVVNIFRRDKGAKADVDGSHATGLDYVNKDGYIGELHKGEMVLTKSTADRFRELGGTKDKVPEVLTRGMVTNKNINNVQNIDKSKHNIDKSSIISKLIRNISNVQNIDKSMQYMETENYNNYRAEKTKPVTIERKKEPLTISLNPIYNIEIKGNVTEEETRSLVKKIDERTRKTFEEMFYELSLQMSNQG